MQQPGGQTWNGGHRLQMWESGTTGPHASDGPDAMAQLHHFVHECEITYSGNETQ